MCIYVCATVYKRTHTHTCLSLQQSHLVGEELHHVFLSKGGREQVAEGGAGGGEQAGQHQALPGPEYSTGEHVLEEEEHQDDDEDDVTVSIALPLTRKEEPGMAKDCL